MRIALDVSMLPDADSQAIAPCIRAWGFDGVIIAGGAGVANESRWTAAPMTPEGLRSVLAGAGLTLAALHTGLSLDHPAGAPLIGAMARMRHALALSAELACRRTVVAAAGPSREPLERRLSRTVAAIRDVAPFAEKAGGRILLDNGGTGLRSPSLWHVRDAAGSASVRYAFRPLDALAEGDPISVSIKQLAGGLDVVFVSDAAIRKGRVTRCTPLGKGDANIVLLIELLKGIAFDGWLCVSWPSLHELGLPETVLPAAVEFLRAEIGRSPVVLSAYKGDKHAPRFRSRAPQADKR
jgi:sugar phosphate isomerase/epimerase